MLCVGVSISEGAPPHKGHIDSMNLQHGRECYNIKKEKRRNRKKKEKDRRLHDCR
jgi:hypothetical protein